MYHPIEITIPDGILCIQNNAFRKQRRLKTVIFPDSLLMIGSNAFASSGLETVMLPSSLSHIDIAPFCYCPHLENITVAQENRAFRSIDGVLFSFDGGILYQYPSGKKEETYIIPQGTYTVKDKAFAGCKSLKTVVIPESMKTIARRAFSGCWNLQEIVIPQWVTRIESQAFSYCTGLQKVTVPRGIYIEKGAFKGCGNIEIISSVSEYSISEIKNSELKIKVVEKKFINEPNAIVLSEKFRTNDVFTTERIFDISAHCELIGKEKQKISKEFIDRSCLNSINIDEKGIIKLGVYSRYVRGVQTPRDEV